MSHTHEYDTISMTSSGGSIKERLSYTPYGVARQRLHADLNDVGVSQAYTILIT